MGVSALAAKAGTSPRTVRELEDSKRTARFGTIRRLAEVLDVEPSELIREG